MDWMGKTNKAMMIVRVSSLGQEHNNSQAYQSSDGKAYAKRMGLDLFEIVQIVESAKRSEMRHHYHRAITTALNRKVRHILFYKVDREARNLTDSEANENLVNQDKIVIHYVAEGKILHKNSPESEFLMRDFQATQNKHYSRELSKKVQRGTIEKAQSGWAPLSQPPLGYINQKQKSEKGFDRRRGSIIVPNPDINAVRLVQREFELRAQQPTPSLLSIRRQIIEEGLIPLDKLKSYHVGSIERRLKNIFYDGRFMWSGQEYEGLHERIISSELFWRVQESFGHRNIYGKKTRGVFRNGWMKCAHPDCGCHIIFDPRKKKIKSTGEEKIYLHYRCTNGKNFHSTTKGMRVTEDALLDQFGGAVRAIAINDKFKDQLVVALNETKHRARRAIQSDISNYQLALKKLENAEDTIYMDKQSGLLDVEGYHRQIQRVRNERARFSELMKSAQVQINDIAMETVHSILQLATDAESLWKRRSPQERAMFLEKLLSNQVLDGSTVRYELIKPLQTLSEMKEDKNWRRGRDLNPRYTF